MSESVGILLFLSDRSKAFTAVHRFIRAGLERKNRFSAAVCTYSRISGPIASYSLFSRITASLASLGLVLKSLFSIEFLFTGCENEFVTAIFAN